MGVFTLTPKFAGITFTCTVAFCVQPAGPVMVTLYAVEAAGLTVGLAALAGVALVQLYVGLLPNELPKTIPVPRATEPPEQMVNGPPAVTVHCAKPSTPCEAILKRRIQ